MTRSIEGNDDYRNAAASSNNNNHDAVTNDLIELLEGQCQMTRDTASKVIANIDRAVRTGDVLENNTHHADNNNNAFSNMMSSSSNNGAIGVGAGGGARTRSKSLGSEPLTYDVNFLGNLLQDAMMMPSSSTTTAATLESTDIMDLSVAATGATAAAAPDAVSQSSSENNTTSASIEDVAMGILRPPPTKNSNSSASVTKSATVGRNKQRSVTFDETQSSFSWYNMPSAASVVSPITDPAVIEEDEGVQFDPLGGILDVLDLEEDTGREQQQQQSHQERQGVVMMDGTSLNTKESIEESEIENEARGSSAVVLETQGGISGGFPQCQMIIHTPSQKVQPSSMSPSSLSAPPPSSSSSAFPTLGETLGNTTTKPPPSSQKQKGRNNKSKKNKEANDLAAALFRPSRSRSNSLMDHPNQRPRALSLASSSMLRPSSADAAGVISAPSSGNGGIGMMGSLLSQSLESAAAASASAVTTVDSESNAIAMTSLSTTSSSSSSPQNISNNNSANSGNAAQSEVHSTTQLLLTLNSHLGTEAASLASQLTDGDLNLAQYLIEAARFDSSSDSRNNNANSYSGPSNRRSRICRHELRGTCYRSDCPYSHDLGGVTCLFWLRGRCRGENCRFMHGFAETLLDGISEEYLNEKREQDAKKEREKEEESKKIRTGNLLQHNQWAATSVSSSGNNLSKSLPNSQGFMFLSEGGNDASMTTMWR